MLLKCCIERLCTDIRPINYNEIVFTVFLWSTVVDSSAWFLPFIRRSFCSIRHMRIHLFACFWVCWWKNIGALFQNESYRIYSTEWVMGESHWWIPSSSSQTHSSTLIKAEQTIQIRKELRNSPESWIIVIKMLWAKNRSALSHTLELVEELLG